MKFLITGLELAMNKSTALLSDLAPAARQRMRFFSLFAYVGVLTLLGVGMASAQHYFPESVWTWENPNADPTTRIYQTLPLADGGMVVGGYTYINSNTRPWIAHLDANRDIVWERTQESVRGVVLDLAIAEGGEITVVYSASATYNYTIVEKVNADTGEVISSQTHSHFADAAFIATDGRVIRTGVNFIAIDGGTPVGLQLPGDRVGRGLAVIEDASGNIWIGGECGTSHA